MNFDWQRILKKHHRLIVSITSICTLLALGYALLKPAAWTATQGLLVRDEALGDMQRVGRFESTDAMQTAQETILELSRFPSVVRPTLERVGPGKKQKSAFPTECDVEALQEAINVSAPGGAQFGRTEMIYLTVKAESPGRAVKLTDAVVDELETQLQGLRRERYVSIISELERTVKLAQDELNRATVEIEEIEANVGTDLVSLRDLTDNQAGEGSLAREFGDLKRELRNAKTDVEKQNNLRQVLLEAYRNPRSIIATPSDLLVTQPSIKRLKDGLIDAQIRTSKLLGVMTPQHPKIKAAKLAEQQIQRQLHNELKTAILGLNSDLKVSRARVARINSQLVSSQGSLLDVGKLRAQYSNLRAEIESKTEFLDKTTMDLARARGNQRASTEVSLLTRVGEPIPSIRPVGPGKKTILLGGFLGGLAIAGGLVFLMEPINLGTQVGSIGQTAYWSGPSRRLTDRVQGRRASDRQEAIESNVRHRRSSDKLPSTHKTLLRDFEDHLVKNARAKEDSRTTPPTGRRESDLRNADTATSDVPPTPSAS